jgi:hypothetical protein
VLCYDILRLSKSQRQGIRVTRPILDQVGKWQRLTRTDEARIHLRDRPRDDLDRAALDASFRFACGLGA